MCVSVQFRCFGSRLAVNLLSLRHCGLGCEIVNYIVAIALFAPSELIELCSAQLIRKDQKKNSLVVFGIEFQSLFENCMFGRVLPFRQRFAHFNFAVRSAGSIDTITVPHDTVFVANGRKVWTFRIMSIVVAAQTAVSLAVPPVWAHLHNGTLTPQMLSLSALAGGVSLMCLTGVRFYTSR